MKGNSLERGIGRSSLTHVDPTTGIITGVPYIKTVRGLGRNGIPFRAQPGHISEKGLGKPGGNVSSQVKNK